MGGANGAQAVANLLNRGENSYGSTGPIVKTTTAVLEPYENVVHANGATTYNVTMPSAASAMIGVAYVVRQVTSSSGAVTVIFEGGTEDPGNWALTAIGDFGVAVSDGQFWYELATVET